VWYIWLSAKTYCKDPLQPHAYLVIMFTFIYIVFFTSNNHTYECALLFNNRKGSCSFWFRSKEDILHISTSSSSRFLFHLSSLSFPSQAFTASFTFSKSTQMSHKSSSLAPSENHLSPIHDSQVQLDQDQYLRTQGQH
jgi:hypothetical protein